MSTQVQAQREYAPQRPRDISEGLIGRGAIEPKQTSNVENLLSSCNSWTDDLEQEITKLIERLEPVLVPGPPSELDPAGNKLNAPMSTVACRLDALAGRLREQTHRIATLTGQIDL